MIEIVESQLVDSLINSGNYLGAIVQIYYEVTGPYLFWVFFLLPIFGSYYIRKQSIIPISLIVGLIYVLIQKHIPAPAFNLVGVFIVISVAVILYYITIGRH